MGELNMRLAIAILILSALCAWSAFGQTNRVRKVHTTNAPPSPPGDMVASLAITNPPPPITNAPGFSWQSSPPSSNYPNALNVIFATSDLVNWQIKYVAPLDGAAHSIVELPQRERCYLLTMTLGTNQHKGTN